MSLGHLFENVPNFRRLLLDHFPGTANGMDKSELLQSADNKRLKKDERHFLRQPALVQFQFRPDNDHRTSGIIDPFSEKILTETSLFPLQHIAQRLQRTIPRSGDRAALTAIVKERIDRLLEHPLLVVNNHIGRLQLEKVFQPVVPVDHAPIKIVQVGSRKTSPFKRNERTQIGRNDRKNFLNHPSWRAVGSDKALDDFQTLRNLFLNLFRARHPKNLLQLGDQWLELHLCKNIANRFRAHFGYECIIAVLVQSLAIFLFGQELLLLKRRPARIDDHVVLVVNDPFQTPGSHIENQTDPARHTLQEPDVRNRNGELNVPHPFTADTRNRYLNSTAVTNDILVFDPLVFSAGAFVIPDRPENPLTEKSSRLRLKGAIIDGFRILDFTC